MFCIINLSYRFILQCENIENIQESGVAELLSAMAAGWNAKLIVEAWTHGGPITTSIGLAIAARHTCARHVCIVPDERSRVAFVKAMYDVVGWASEVIVRQAEAVMGELKGVDFLVVDCKSKDFARVLRFARFSNKGAVLAFKNALQRSGSGFRRQGQGVLDRGTRVVRSVFLPVGQGLDIVHVGSTCGLGMGESLNKNHSRWIKHVDQRSGEEHVFRGKF